MIEYRKGCLITALKLGEVNAIAHGVNCQGVMGSGIAVQIRNEWMDVYYKYRDFYMREGSYPEDLLGKCNKVITYDDKIVYNLFTQLTFGKFGRHVSYEALFKAFSEMLADPELPVIIGIPRIGCGLAGGDWDVVSRLIEAALIAFGKNNTHKVICYEI